MLVFRGSVLFRAPGDIGGVLVMETPYIHYQYTTNIPLMFSGDFCIGTIGCYSGSNSDDSAIMYIIASLLPVAL